MKRVLLTGMSGTGKSSVVRELVARGYKAVDTEDAEVLFVAGCEENQVAFHPRFDQIILLSAPIETVLERLSTRTTNAFGKSAEERQRVLDDTATVEPLLRGVADHEVVTTAPLADVVTTVLRLVGA